MTFRRAVALVGVLWVALLSLSGCVYSHRDLAGELSPEYPMSEGAYVDNKGAELRVEKAGSLYRVTDPDNETYEIAFFKIPDYAGYVVRLNPERVGTAATTIRRSRLRIRSPGDKHDGVLCRRQGCDVPPEAEALVASKPSDDSGFGVRDEKDTCTSSGSLRTAAS